MRASGQWWPSTRRVLWLQPPRHRALSTAPAAPAALPLPPELRARVSATATARSLRERGFAVLDNVLGATWCHLLRDDIITLAEQSALGRNATHLVQPDGTLQLLAKRGIFETELHDASLRAACPWLSHLASDELLSAGLADALEGRRLPRWTIKVQLNGGGGACFPYHFDSDRNLDSRVVTAILYLNPDWEPAHGGQLQMLPFPLAPVEVDPVFDRLCAPRHMCTHMLYRFRSALCVRSASMALILRRARCACCPACTRRVLFSSVDMLHRVLPSHSTRLCLTLWFYADDNDGAAPAGDAPSLRGVQVETEAKSDSSSDPLRVLMERDFRHMFARLVYAEEWAVSIEESHEPSDARAAALEKHWMDVEHIKAAACQRLQAAGFGIRDLEDACNQLPLPADATPDYVRYFED